MATHFGDDRIRLSLPHIVCPMPAVQQRRGSAMQVRESTSHTVKGRDPALIRAGKEQAFSKPRQPGSTDRLNHQQRHGGGHS